MLRNIGARVEKQPFSNRLQTVLERDFWHDMHVSWVKHGETMVKVGEESGETEDESDICRQGLKIPIRFD